MTPEQCLTHLREFANTLLEKSRAATPQPWFKIATPGYLARGQQADGSARRTDPITLMSAAHTEELLTVWTYLLPTEANANFVMDAVNSAMPMASAQLMLIDVLEAARAYRKAEQDGTPRIWKGKDLCDLADKLDAVIERVLPEKKVEK